MAQTKAQAGEDGSLTALLTVQEAAALGRYAVGTIYNKISSGELVPVAWRGGKHPMLDRADVLALWEKKPRERAPRKKGA